MAQQDTQTALREDNLFSRIVTAVMVATALFAIVTVSANSIMRYIVRKDIRAVEEFVTIAAFWMYFAGAIYAAKRRTHISARAIELFIKNPRMLYACEMFQRLVSFSLGLVFSWWGWEFFWWGLNHGGRSNIWQVPLVVGQCSVSIAFAAILVYLARDILMLLRVKPSEYKPGAA